MIASKSKKEWEEEFKRIYKEILKGERIAAEIYAENDEKLIQFKREHTLDINSIEFLPAYFNFIECALLMEYKAEVKRYLIVGLYNILLSSKKSEESKREAKSEDQKGEESTEDESGVSPSKEEENYKNNLKSRLDLLFARYNLDEENYKVAIEKLTSSIITYSEIYGPESVGLTPHYYYLANYFLVRKLKPDDKSDKKDIIVKNIYLKIAEIWKKYFIGEKNYLFEINVDTSLNLAIGDHFVKKIIGRIKGNYSNDKELDLKFKIIRVLILKELGSDLYKELLNQVKKIREMQTNILDKSFIEDLSEKLN